MSAVNTLATAKIGPDGQISLTGIRRADRFTKMAAQAASDALTASGIARKPGDDSIGIILSTHFGPHATTTEFVDGMLEFGDAAASPTAFSHSVHNAAVAYIAMALDLRGPAMAVTGFNDPYRAAKQLAAAWLAEGRVTYVLVGRAEDSSPMMDDMHAHVPLPGCGARGIDVGAEFMLVTKE